MATPASGAPDQAHREGQAYADEAGRWRPRKLKKDGTPRKSRRGWGPYRTVPNERSAAFNLTLDVQNLQQTVRNLTALRDILHTKTLVQRHSPEGSLSKLVHEYLHVFRKGVLPLEMADDRDQAFMRRVMAEEVDLGYGVCGPGAIMEQMANYSTFLRFISLRGLVDTIVVAEDSVLISDKAWFRFQVTRRTIEMVFPHILGNEWLVAQLVGQEVEAQGRSTFHFNATGKCFRYNVEMDFVGAFMRVVKDPRIVKVLLGPALITHNAMLGVIDDPEEREDEEDEEKAPAPHRDRSEKGNCGQQNVRHTPGPRTGVSSSDEFCHRIVDEYFAAFASGYHKDASSQVLQRNFLQHRFASKKQVDVANESNRVKERWCALSKCFDLVQFQQESEARTALFDDSSNLCQVESAARYTLCITFRTIESVFPHLVSSTTLLDALVGAVIEVPSQILFSIEKRSGHISSINEKMEFAAAMAEIVPERHELSFVLSNALLVDDGVGYDSSSVASALAPPALYQHKQHFHQTQVCENYRDDSGPISRTMNIADILG
ncbi:hypothetical protein PF008_g26820 [Phytophthora fragariae]|uniref:Uncharacterized protein n=1 Tax=Phytophthora fragariae TaxID=53985 RepID=A0A6G0QGT7_9STRA|nr:hypothetical protein PF008_g26820 [Phytophthora fragariae]